ncbi:MAG: hypothetical protein EA383_10155 [Spirochaetaceae bacterium]|nr:MAG: hypothetical protein EA383_10155 [Spirochaetaceae bacterium]
MADTPNVAKHLRGPNAYYHVTWSPVVRAVRHDIIRVVPAVAGLFELFVLDTGRTLNPIRTSGAWYGGLRSTLRELADPQTCRDKRVRSFLARNKLYYRFSTCDSHEDMQDVLACIAAVRPRSVQEATPSGRYEGLFLRESAIGGMVRID